MPTGASRDKLLASITSEKDPRVKVERALTLAQSLLNGQFGTGPADETQREFCARVAMKAPGLRVPLNRIVEIFEQVRYRDETVNESLSKEAADALTKIINFLSA
jgi:hypothetical protein